MRVVDYTLLRMITDWSRGSMDTPVIDLSVCRLHRDAVKMCSRRNTNLCFEQGKSLCERCDDGVVFYFSHFKLDSMHSDFSSPVAKIVLDSEQQGWRCFFVNHGFESLLEYHQQQLSDFFAERYLSVMNERYAWKVYSPLPSSLDATSLLREVEQDPHRMIWL